MGTLDGSPRHHAFSIAQRVNRCFVNHGLRHACLQLTSQPDDCEKQEPNEEWEQDYEYQDVNLFIVQPNGSPSAVKDDNTCIENKFY